MSTFKSYIIGFISSVVLTLAAYFFVMAHINSGHTEFSHGFLNIGLGLLAILQVIVQLIFFLHFGKGKDTKWNLTVFASSVSIILILVIGSIWIMNHLNYNMTPDQMDRELLKTEGMH